MEQPGKTSAAERPEEAPVPVTMEQIESLRNCITNTITSYRRKRRRNKIGAISVQTLSILFSFGTTILIGWKLKTEPQDVVNNATAISSLTNAALIISALATGINTLDKFFDYKALWIGYNISIANLKSALAKLDYLASLGADRLKRNQLDDVFSRYEMICANMDKNYQEIRSSRDE